MTFENEVRKLLVAYHLASGHDQQQKGVGLDTAKCIQGACARYNEVFDAEFASRSGPPTGEETRHIVDMKDGGWTIQHPLACRESGELFDCEYTKAMQENPDPGVRGRFELFVNEWGGRDLLPLTTDGASGGRLNVLRGPVEFDYDPDDKPRGTLVPTDEEPEVI